ncbi:hypothetical protein [Sansalvadorimonas verongulae]|uniref:hypothetical protein n=1 Tax=Sansalvadorimonas verongulae TaxID=2172824 RepID=UPI0012BC07E0|nr:hypothetical protein [Sansalvadorimonas verongulae]MTI12414.1 hypothetical protein [Sansalvadorimonas verongulae]
MPTHDSGAMNTESRTSHEKHNQQQAREQFYYSLAERLDGKFGVVFKNIWWPRNQSQTMRKLVVQEWADALLRNRITGQEAHAALHHVCDNFSKPPSIAEFLEHAKGTRRKPLAHRKYNREEDRVVDKSKRAKSMKTASFFLDEIYASLGGDSDV